MKLRQQEFGVNDYKSSISGSFFDNMKIYLKKTEFCVLLILIVVLQILRFLEFGYSSKLFLEIGTLGLLFVTVLVKSYA